MNKKGQSDFIKIIFAVVLIGLAVQMFFPGTLQSITGGTGEQTTEELLTSDAICTGDKTNTFSFGPLFTKYGAQITSGENVAWWKNGVYQGTNAVDSTTSLTFGDELGFEVGADSSTYYANYFTTKMPCGASDLGSLATKDENELWTADVDYTINLFNSDNGLLNADGTNETINAGEQGSWDVKIEGTSEQAVSPNGNLLVVLGQDKNNFTSGQATWNGASPSGSLPSWFTTQNNFAYSVWEMEGGPKTGKLFSTTGKLTVQAKDGVDPVTIGNKGDFLNLTIVNSDYDIDTNTNQILGNGRPVYEDNDGTRSGFVTDGVTIFIE